MPEAVGCGDDPDRNGMYKLCSVITVVLASFDRIALVCCLSHRHFFQPNEMIWMMLTMLVRPHQRRRNTRMLGLWTSMRQVCSDSIPDMHTV